MELAEKFGRWSATVSVCNYVSSTVLKSLKAMHVKLRDAREERIAVVDASANDGDCEQVCRRSVKKTPDMTESPKVVIDAFTNLEYVIRKGELSMKCNPSNFNRMKRRYIGDSKIGFIRFKD